MITGWTDAEIKRFLARMGIFMRRGLSESEAERLGEKCLERDRRIYGWDDMHACIECAHVQRYGKCSKHRFALPLSIFHRCRSFGWQVPKAV